MFMKNKNILSPTKNQEAPKAAEKLLKNMSQKKVQKIMIMYQFNIIMKIDLKMLKLLNDMKKIPEKAPK